MDVLSVMSNRSLCFTKGMGEKNQYFICSLHRTPSLTNVLYILRHCSFCPWTREWVEVKEGAEAPVFCILEGSRTERIKLIHLKLRLRVLGFHKNMSLPTASVIACGIYSKSTRHTYQHICTNSSGTCQHHTWTTASKWRRWHVSGTKTYVMTVLF